MSGRVTGWVGKHGPRPDDVDREGQPYGTSRARAMRLVLAPIADAANQEGEDSHPGMGAIRSWTFYSERQVVRILDDLEAENWVAVMEKGNGRGHATKYRVNLDRRRPKGDTVSDRRVTPRPGKGDIPAPERVTPGAAALSTPTGKTNGVHNAQELQLIPGGPEQADPVEAVFAAWLASTGRSHRTVLDTKRRRTIRAALDLYPLEDVLDAVRGWEHSAFHRGEHPQNRASRPYNDLDLLLRDAAHIERFRDLARGPVEPDQRNGPTRVRDTRVRIDSDRDGPSGRVTL